MNDNDKKLTGQEYWRSLEQLEDTPEYREFLYREFPQGASEIDNSWSRRSFLSLMGASAALAGLSSCRRPVEKIVPYVVQPEEVTPGTSAYYATSMPFGLAAYGLLVRSYAGRPTKIEGNPSHPSTMGSSNRIMQAELLNVYDPDRSQIVTQKSMVKSWDEFTTFWRERLAYFQANQGNGLAFLTEAFHSPTMARLAETIRTNFPRATWVAYEPVGDENAHEGVLIATGRALQPIYNIDKASVILALDSNFLCDDPDSIRLSRAFADGRRIVSKTDSMNRLYAVESRYSVTGAAADHRLRIPSHQIADFVLALGRELQSQGLTVSGLSGVTTQPTGDYDRKWLSALAKDLVRAHGASLVVVGSNQPPAVHAMTVALNEALGSIGTTLTFVEPQDAMRPVRGELAGLVNQMNTGGVDTLVILGGNPVYNAPADANFGAALQRVAHSIHLSLYRDETSAVAEWNLPRSHFLESWGDVRALDGTLSVVQPLIEPLYDTRSIWEVTNLMATGVDARGYEAIRETWQSVLPGMNFENDWRRVLHDGLAEGTASQPVTPSIIGPSIAAFIADHPLPPISSDGLEITFHETHLWDGRYANNGWLQELPDPITRLTWDNPALMSARTAAALGVASGDVVRIELASREIQVPVWISPGHADNSIALGLGFGRTLAGRVGDGVGFDTYRIRIFDTMGIATGARISPTNQKYELASVQDHGSMEGRPILREATLEQYQKTGEFLPPQPEHPPLIPLWDPFTYDEGYQWGMAIDLTVCTGCNACVIACQAENNIPIVGKEQVARGREMHWLRMDRYYKGHVDNPVVSHQPMLCQHCENAPCETVCPVAATVHDKEGLNVMVYNRCIGTRYCSNNCPYKVRRFNFFNYTKDLPETVHMAMNPDVTVRSRGVMEKCTYCIQRINAGKLAAKKEGRLVQDGDVVTACQQACPSKAIVFGNIRDPQSEVIRQKKLDRDYRVLQEYNTQPRTSYLGKIRNINPEIGEPPIPADVHATHKG